MIVSFSVDIISVIANKVLYFSIDRKHYKIITALMVVFFETVG